MILEQFYLGCLAHASYLIGDESSKTAVVVDPQRDIDQYVARAEAAGLEIKHVVLTHFHADFIAGHLELRERTGATIHLGARAEAEFPFHPLSEGDTIDLGGVFVRTLETPGHTPESICLLVFDRKKSTSEPCAVLTGDTLFIGDVGRPDLLVSSGCTAEDLAGQLFDSLRHKLMPLPDETLVYPAHGAGSFCGKNMSKDTVSTIGAQRRLNLALRPISRDVFIAEITAGQAEMPAYFGYDAALNKKERPTLRTTIGASTRALDLPAALDAVGRGASIVDAREPPEFSRGHLRGSINVGLSGKYCTWVGTVVDRRTPIVILAEPGKENEAIMRLGRIGFDQVIGFVSGGFEAARARPDLIATHERIDAATLARELSGATPPVVLDVRAVGEREQGAISGSLHVPLQQLAARADEVPRDRRVVVHCAGGFRSSIAASLLRARGFESIADLIGGYAAWSAR